MNYFLEEWEIEELRNRVLGVLKSGSYSIGGIGRACAVHPTTIKRFLQKGTTGLQQMVKIKNWLDSNENNCQ